MPQTAFDEVGTPSRQSQKLAKQARRAKREASQEVSQEASQEMALDSSTVEPVLQPETSSDLIVLETGKTPASLTQQPRPQAVGHHQSIQTVWIPDNVVQQVVAQEAAPRKIVLPAEEIPVPTLNVKDAAWTEDALPVEQVALHAEEEGKRSNCSQLQQEYADLLLAAATADRQRLREVSAMLYKDCSG